LISQLIPTPSRFGAALAGAALALVPDADYLLFRSDRLAFIHHHRGFTHSLAALPLLALLGAGINSAIWGKEWFRSFLLLGAAVLASHLLLDWATSYGTQLLNPFSRRKFALDWLFIIDPYLTAILAAGAAAAFTFPGWGRQAGAVCLAGAGAYFLLCGCYHYQALSLARQAFVPEARAGAEIAALPQPFSPRRWQLIAAKPGKTRQAMVELPYLPRLQLPGGATEVREAAANQSYPGPFTAAYRLPESLIILERQAPAGVLPLLSPEARRILDIYLDFARFPLLARFEPDDGGFLLEWADLRFAVPGRALPFLLRLRLDPRGEVKEASLGGGRIDHLP
jgi:inner membrane protein